jgi:DNA-directed RNA polymerase subunit F
MTAQQELQTWLEQHRQLNNEAEREQFYQKIFATLDGKASDDLREGLSALKKSVKATRVKAEKMTKTQAAASLQVFPKNREEQQLLQKLLERMDIPFKMSA